jgi:hypothetical protein
MGTEWVRVVRWRDARNRSGTSGVAAGERPGTNPVLTGSQAISRSMRGVTNQRS